MVQLLVLLICNTITLTNGLVLLKQVNISSGNNNNSPIIPPNDHIRKRNTFDEKTDIIYYKPNSHVLSSTTPAAYHRETIPPDINVTRTDQLFYGTLKPYVYKPSKVFEHLNITYVGCYSTWNSQFTDKNPANLTHKYDSAQFHTHCAARCKEKGELLQLVFVKGVECECAPIYSFNASQISPAHCNIPCPIKSYVPGNHAPENPCGGNLGYSVYCLHDVNSPNSCAEILQTAELQRRRFTAGVGPPKLHTPVLLENACVSCNWSTNLACSHSYTYADFDYFPVNTPEECVSFCNKTVSSINRQKAEIRRPPTKYALLTWWRDQDTDLPVCSCVNDNVRGLYKDTNVTNCDKQCPGEETTCGGTEKYFTFYATVFCTEQEETCRGSSIPAPSTTTTTTEKTVPPIVNPCELEDVGCEEEDPIVLPGFPHTTTARPNGSTIDTTLYPDQSTGYTGTDEFTPDVTTTMVTTTSESTPEGTPPEHTSTTTSTTTTTTSTSTLPPVYGCKKCRAVDRRGVLWEACVTETAKIACSHLGINSTGHAFWRCGSSGLFETPQPDVSNCTSVWLEEKQEQIKHIQDIEEASDFVNDLSDSVRTSSTYQNKFYGPEMSTIVLLVTQSITKAREFMHTNGSEANFDNLVNIVDRAVGLNTYLISIPDPWKDLNVSEKSSISTTIINNTEEVLFHLTNEVSHNYVRLFEFNNTDHGSLVVFAESLDKDTVPSSVAYEFPSKEIRGDHDSFIKLPRAWVDKLPDREVEIAAMVLGSEYVSNLMPGQYDSLVSISNINGSNVPNPKLINGNLMSLSLMSSPDNSYTNNSHRASISFKDKGVEIVFQHDIEAWGEGPRNVPRKLHKGELPKAVLGSSDCVFWNTKDHSWSSRGCRVVRSTRYETVCECNHLTSFAILMDVHRYVGKDYGLELLTLILCPASEVALFVSVILLSSVNGLQKIRATITKNLSICLLVGNALVLFVLDRHYFDMSDGVCIAAAMITHYVYLAAFSWMLIEGIQLYRMVVHVFDSGRSYIKHFGVFAYGCPLIIIAVTACAGYLKGDQPYGSDVYCWLEGPYIWSFMAPVAFVTTVNLVILFIALKTAYQVQQNKIHSQIFIMGKIRSCKTWFKGCFSLTVILGLTWVVGFFTLMRSPGGIVAAYIFTVLNASQGIFIFVFNCVLNEKVRTSTQRNLSTYLPSWMSSSSSNRGGKDGSLYGKRQLSSLKSNDLDSKSTRRISESSNKSSVIVTKPRLRACVADPPNNKPAADPPCNRRNRRSTRVEFLDDKEYRTPAVRTESVGTISSSTESIQNSSPVSDNGHISSDNSQNTLISRHRF